MFINTFNTSLKVNAGTSNIQTKNISDGWLVYLRSYNSNYTLDNITISNNMSISDNLGNEQVRIHRRIGSSEYIMPTNFNIHNNYDVYERLWTVFDYAITNTIKNENLSNGTLYSQVLSDKYDNNAFNIASINESLEVDGGVIDIPDDATLYIDGEYLIEYNGEVLAPGNYRVIIERKSSSAVNVEGIKSETFETTYLTLAEINIEKTEDFVFSLKDNYNLKKNETVSLAIEGAESITYQSSDNSIAIVDENGTVKV